MSHPQEKLNREQVVRIRCAAIAQAIMQQALGDTSLYDARSWERVYAGLQAIVADNDIVGIGGVHAVEESITEAALGSSLSMRPFIVPSVAGPAVGEFGWARR